MDKRLLTVIVALLLAVQLWAQLYPDTFSHEPYGSYESRREEFIRYYTRPDSTIHPLYRVFRQLTLAAGGRPLEASEMDAVFDVIKSNRDCNDFALNGLLRLKLLYADALDSDMHDKARKRILDFKYWWDDARRDTTYRCYHTENHQALYHTAELLAGQMYKHERFSDGQTGLGHIAHATSHLLPWLDYRFRFGFSEWNSTYYDADALLLLNLYDFAEDPEIRRRAANVLHLLFFDMAIGNYRGFMGAASSRNYAHSLIGGTHNTSALMKLVFGVGSYCRNELMGTSAMITSNYRCPQVIVDIATDYVTPVLSYQRNSIEPDDAALYGLDYDNETHCRLFWGMQEFIHPKVVRKSKDMSMKYNTWPYGNYDEHIGRYEREIAATGKAVSHDRFALSEGNIVSLRTNNYMLSSVQDYRKGRQGYQQHVWQATLGNRALVYTNSPGGADLKSSPNYWAGSEWLPRVAQHGKVAVIIYNEARSHAYFPIAEFDSVVYAPNQIIAMKGDGMVSVWSSSDAALKKDFRGVECDFSTESKKNVYICEVGDIAEYGSFGEFVRAMTAADRSADVERVRYQSPSEGLLEFGWESDFTVNGKVEDLRRAMRYDNPYCRAFFPANVITICRKNKILTLAR